MKKQHGFTLVEILVVVIILAIAASFVVLNLGNRDSNHRVQILADHFAQVIPVAQQTAIMQPAVLGLQITPHGYQWLRYTLNDNSKIGHWDIVRNESTLAAQTLPDDIIISLRVLAHQSGLNSKTEPGTTQKPQLIITPSGEFAPFILTLATRDGKSRYQVEGKANGEIKITNIANKHAK